MRYIKAEEVLPRELVLQIQQYVDGVTLYIPRKTENRRPWGCGTDYRQELEKRNAAICAEHAAGATILELSRRYHLTEKSIGRILRETES